MPVERALRDEVNQRSEVTGGSGTVQTGSDADVEGRTMTRTDDDT
ncbi:MAG: hypothetical protein QOI25_3741 [Mycobacterium sp.]|jgi:hypothetical protein|nr:hypothetical protein [Mycobacterium sp.]